MTLVLDLRVRSEVDEWKQCVQGTYNNDEKEEDEEDDADLLHGGVSVVFDDEDVEGWRGRKVAGR